MEEEAKKAQLEVALDGEDVDEEDHGDRRLPQKGERLFWVTGFVIGGWSDNMVK
jgi:hypothetical protein